MYTALSNASHGKWWRSGDEPARETASQKQLQASQPAEREARQILQRSRSRGGVWSLNRLPVAAFANGNGKVVGKCCVSQPLPCFWPIQWFGYRGGSHQASNGWPMAPGHSQVWSPTNGSVIMVVEKLKELVMSVSFKLVVEHSNGEIC